jgi:cephalosporin hydroxylase
MTDNSREPIEARLNRPLREYWLERARQHTDDTYLGVGLSKFPEDLRTYEHLIWETRANAVVEIGTQFGGSALWFRDRLVSLCRYRPDLPAPVVVSIDVDVSVARRHLAAVDPDYEQTIKLLEGDVQDASIALAAQGELPEGSRCLVVDDSAHTYETTSAALRYFAGLVPVGGYFVVEDGAVDIQEMRLYDTWPHGVLPAIDEWLASEPGSAFVQRRDSEHYVMTAHPRGYLQRVR